MRALQGFAMESILIALNAPPRPADAGRPSPLLAHARGGGIRRPQCSPHLIPPPRSAGREGERKRARVGDGAFGECSQPDRICPTGKIRMHVMRELPVAPICRKRSYCRLPQISGISPPSRARPKGRFAIVTSVGRGMRWTCWCRRTSDADADGEGVWFWRPLAGAKPAGSRCRP